MKPTLFKIGNFELKNIQSNVYSGFYYRDKKLLKRMMLLKKEA